MPWKEKPKAGISVKPIIMQVQYISNQSILVINPKGKMRTLYTPFRVFDSANSSWVYVEEVGTGTNDELLFVIGGQIFSHSQFQIRIHF
jgi:hypothetical protein